MFCVFMYVCICACAFMYVCGCGQVINSYQVSFLTTFYPIFEIFQWTWPCQLAHLSSQGAQGPVAICWVLGYRHVQLCLTFYVCSGDLVSSCLCKKHFTNRGLPSSTHPLNFLIVKYYLESLYSHHYNVFVLPFVVLVNLFLLFQNTKWLIIYT